MLFVVIFIGFFMLTIGVALLFVGETPFLGGKRIPATRARLVGVILVSFLPLALGVRRLSTFVFDPEAVHGMVITGLLFVFCWIGIFALLLPLLLAKPAKREAKAAKEVEFEDAPPIPIEVASEPAEPKATAKKSAPAKKASRPSRPSVEEKNPLDFS